MSYIICFLVLIACELIYFRIADKYNIIDKPNHRSSHTSVTIRGGGIIFPIAVILWFLFWGFQYPLVICGLVLISVISFIDDLRSVSRSLRLLLHLIAVSLAFWALNIYSFDWYVIVFAYVMMVGIINAYNFMDGINGITGVYSLVFFCTMLWINQFQFSFIVNKLLVTLIIGVLIFIFFNFRKKAKCFAGDVGSVSLAFIIGFLLLRLILETGQVSYIFLLAIYGVDAVFTIVVRLSKGENIFEAHRLHLYQLLANERKIQHRIVAAGYGIIQLIVNILLVYFIKTQSLPGIFASFTALVLFYWIVRIRVLTLNKEQDAESKKQETSINA